MLNFAPVKTLAPLLLLGLALGGCNAISSLNPLTSKPVVDLSKYNTGGSVYCPKVQLRQGTESFNVYEKGFDKDPRHLVHQARIEKTARECSLQDGKLVMRIGVNGRVLAGPRGVSTTLSVPIRVVVVKHQDAVLYSEIHPISVQISDFDRTPDFVTVVNVAVPDPGEDKNYIVYVGFDRKEDT
ncbi:MAG: hypothetical protein COA52_12665 [Hyphomicrobiales bacterium]|nr:MAG: hypothetical protein COA52_12665 [Hyphomicrobiales bacterium]